MLGRIKDAGPTIRCDACSEDIVDNGGLVVWEKGGPQQASVLVIHKRCEGNPIVRTLYPRGIRQQPLAQYLETLLECLTV